MRIALLAHALRGGGGISVGRNIIAALGRIAGGESYFLSLPGGLGYEEVCPGLPDRRAIYLEDHSWPSRWRFDRRLLPEELARFRPDVVVGMASLGYQGRGRFPQAVLCHNPYLLYPRRHFGRTISCKELIEIYLKRRVFARDLGRTGLLFTQTRSAAGRIESRYGYRGRSVALPNAISEFTRSGDPGASPPSPLRQYADNFKLFYLTRYYPHKNIEILVDLCDRYRDDLRGTTIFITVAGDQHPAVRRLLAAVREKNLEAMIVNLGPLPQSELAAYFRRMDGLLMPSLLESFSGSYLEAMHYGAPILTSDLDFAREVCGEAALYFDPWNPASIRDTIIRLRDEPGLSGNLSRLGREQAAGRFIGWDEVTAIFLSGLRGLAGRASY